MSGALTPFALALAVEFLLPRAGLPGDPVDEVERRELVGRRGFLVVAVQRRDELRVALRVASDGQRVAEGVDKLAA